MIAFFVILGLLMLWMIIEFINHHYVKAVNFDICTPTDDFDLKNEQFCLIADYHNNSLFKSDKRILEIIRNSGCRLTVIAGDMVYCASKNQNHAVNMIKAISELTDVIYVAGNHEFKYKNRHPEEYRYYMEQLSDIDNVYYLENNNFVYGNLIFTGLYNSDIESAGILYNKKPGKYHILIAHDPSNSDVFAAVGYDMILSGHIHGGLIRLPFIGGLIAPGVIFRPKYDKGLYTINNSTLVLTSGLGSHTIPLRFCNRAEVVKININKGTNNGVIG